MHSPHFSMQLLAKVILNFVHCAFRLSRMFLFLWPITMPTIQYSMTLFVKTLKCLTRTTMDFFSTLGELYWILTTSIDGLGENFQKSGKATSCYCLYVLFWHYRPFEAILVRNVFLWSLQSLCMHYFCLCTR